MKDTFNSVANSMTELLERAHESIVSMLHEGNIDAALGLLEDCQDGAIVLGTGIEELQKATDTVTILEQYCETLYLLHEELLNHDAVDMIDTTRFSDILSQNLHAIKESVRKNILDRKTAVFLPYKASMWDSLESVWKAADTDPDCDVYVIPIPYYDKTADGMLGEMHYEGNLYPAYVPVTDYESFDFGRIRPDMIFIHNPYDEYNHATSVHPFFYSKNLKKFTGNLVYIPYFVLSEIDPADEETVKGIAHFCTAPGVIHADTVIVQSEKMRQIYIRALTETFGEKTRAVWEKKILGLGSPKYDKVLGDAADMTVPKEWERLICKEDGSRKKVVFYNTGLGAMLEYEDAMLDKIESALRQFYLMRDETVLLWRPHPLMRATLQSMTPRLLERYEKLVKTYREEKWGIYDDTADLNRAIRISDAYYGDPSSVTLLFRRVGKPVLVQQVNIRESEQSS